VFLQDSHGCSVYVDRARLVAFGSLIDYLNLEAAILLALANQDAVQDNSQLAVAKADILPA
jgi:hypothetical protein